MKEDVKEAIESIRVNCQMVKDLASNICSKWSKDFKELKELELNLRSEIIEDFMKNFFKDYSGTLCEEDLKKGLSNCKKMVEESSDLIGDAKSFNPEELKKMVVFTDSERILGKGKIGPGWECKQGKMKNAEQHKEDTEMKRSTELERLIENIADARINILIGSQSEITLFRSIEKLRSVAQDAVNSETFSDEKDLLMELLKNIHNLMMRDITRDIFGKYLDNLLKALGVKLKVLKEQEKKEAFKNKILENIDLLYEVHKRLNQE